MKNRLDFGKYCQEQGYLRGVEIGTDRAHFAATILKDWTCCEEFWCFDPYEPVSDFPHDRTPDMMMACIRLAPFVPVAKIIRATSEGGPARLWFKPDFVYIDGDHSYEAVKQDIAVWWPLVTSGGTLAGHDYIHWTQGVIDAVNEFVKVEGLDLRIIKDEKSAWSWMVVKP